LYASVFNGVLFPLSDNNHTTTGIRRAIGGTLERRGSKLLMYTECVIILDPPSEHHVQVIYGALSSTSQINFEAVLIKVV
jgi:hypothetical protein